MLKQYLIMIGEKAVENLHVRFGLVFELRLRGGGCEVNFYQLKNPPLAPEKDHGDRAEHGVCHFPACSLS